MVGFLIKHALPWYVLFVGTTNADNFVECNTYFYNNQVGKVTFKPSFFNATFLVGRADDAVLFLERDPLLAIILMLTIFL